MTERRAVAACWVLAGLAALVYLGAAWRAGLDAVARWGGAAWVGLLTLIITLPVLLPLARRARH